MSQTPDNWQHLFPPPAQPGAGTKVPWQVLRKNGEPLLVMPAQGKLAAASLGLYPAQTAKARLLRHCLLWSLRLGLPLPLKRVTLPVDPQTPFARFLARAAGSATLPPLAIYAGNPRAPGRRYILLLFDRQGGPVCVVKAGLTPAARELIERERAFLSSVQTTIQGVPKLLEGFQTGSPAAFPMEFLAGDSPAPGDDELIGPILTTWIHPAGTVAVADTEPWKDLERACAGQTLLNQLGGLRSRPVRSVIWHGDFAPWNMKWCRRTGRCVVLDWERGQPAGLPGWDWFHYVIQTGILVARLPTAKLVERIESLLNSDGFKAYAERGQIRGVEKELVVAYLLHQYEVIKPSEGSSLGRPLLAELASRWLKR